jgi:hypothetical protein
MDFAGDYYGAAYFCPTHAGNAHITIGGNGVVVGTVFNACNNTTSQINGEINNAGNMVGDLTNPPRDVAGTLTISQNDLTGHLNVEGSLDGLDLSMKRF